MALRDVQPDDGGSMSANKPIGNSVR